MPRVKLLILGDSILASITPQTQNIAQLLRARRVGQDFAVHNGAVPGHTSAFCLADWEEKYRGAGYTHLLVMIGTNSAAARVPAIAIYADVLEIITQALADGMGVMVGTMLPRSSGPAYGADLQEILDEVNELIRDMPTEVDARIKVVDFYAVMGEPGTPTRLRISDDMGDGLHPYLFVRMADAVDALGAW